LLGPTAGLNTTVVASLCVLASLSQIILGLMCRASVAYTRITECWQLKKRDASKLKVTKIKCRRSLLNIKRTSEEIRVV
jgi:hypothetical protein